MAKKQDNDKGKTRSKRRISKITHYYEMIYPVRKLRRIWHATGSTKALRAWADSYKTPTGASGNGALVRLNKELKLGI